MAAYKICRICLLTDVALQEMEGTYLDHFEDICSCETGYAEHLCCSPCYDALKINLKFTYKCVEANKILQEWKKDKSPEKPSIQSLCKLLKTLKNNELTNKSSKVKKKVQEKNKLDYDTENSQVTIKDIKVENDVNINFEVQIEKNVNNINFEVQDCDNIDFYDNEGIEYDVKDLKSEDSEHKELSNVNPPGDVKRLKVKTKKVKKDTENIKQKIVREYDQYEEVFKIELFQTNEDARKELLSRLHLEPYVSAQYRCELCYTAFKSDKLLMFHKKWHNESSPLECPVCSFRFLTRKSLRNHRSKCHRGKFCCKLCPLVTYHESVMKRHFEKHQGKTYKCDCGRAFKHMSTYLNHKRNVHVSCHVCVTCARTFVSQLGLRNHRARAHQTKSEDPTSDSVPCALCALSFPSQLVCNVHLLSTHKHTQLAKDTIACRHCGLPFDNAAQLKEHNKQRHLPPKDDGASVTCELCGAEGSGRAWRVGHYKTEHPHVRCQSAGEDATQHMCDQCGRLFSSAYVLRDHLNGHLGLRPWACRQCGAAFSSSSARSQHEVRHGPALRCPYCPARFHSSSGLCMHKRRHVGTRSHACPLCARAFLLASQLRDHVSSVHQHCRRAKTRTKPRATRPVQSPE